MKYWQTAQLSSSVLIFPTVKMCLRKYFWLCFSKYNSVGTQEVEEEERIELASKPIEVNNEPLIGGEKVSYVPTITPQTFGLSDFPFIDDDDDDRIPLFEASKFVTAI